MKAIKHIGIRYIELRATVLRLYKSLVNLSDVVKRYKQASLCFEVLSDNVL